MSGGSGQGTAGVVNVSNGENPELVTDCYQWVDEHDQVIFSSAEFTLDVEQQGRRVMRENPVARLVVRELTEPL